MSPPCSLPISMGGQIKAVERLAPGGLEHQRGPPRSRTSSKSGLADAPSSSSLSPYSYARRLRLTDVFTAGSTANPRADRGRRHPAICCGRDARRPPNTSKAIILTSAELKRMVSSAGLRPPRSARVQTSDYSRSPCNSNLANRSKVPYEPEKFRYAPAKSRF